MLDRIKRELLDANRDLAVDALVGLSILLDHTTRHNMIEALTSARAIIHVFLRAASDKMTKEAARDRIASIVKCFCD